CGRDRGRSLRERSRGKGDETEQRDTSDHTSLPRPWPKSRSLASARDDNCKLPRDGGRASQECDEFVRLSRHSKKLSALVSIRIDDRVQRQRDGIELLLL